MMRQRFNIKTYKSFYHLNSIVERQFDLFSFLALPGNTFQNLRVSSPAPVTMVSPVGFIAKKSTRLVCPVNVANF